MKSSVIAGVYLITSPSGKHYIGQSKDIKKRLNQYRLGHCKGQRYLCNSIKKYGWRNHKVRLLFYTADMTNIKDVLNQLERDFIYLYDSIAPNGMNLKAGGDAGNPSMETRKLMSDARKGKKLSEGTKRKLSEINKTKGSPQIEWNNLSEVSKQKVIDSLRRNNELKKKVIKQFNINGELVKVWNSINEASIELGYDRSAIIRTCQGKQRTSYGFKWCYDD